MPPNLARYRGDAAGALLIEPLDGLVAAYHRPSGTTHLLASPAPEILAVLGEEPLTAAQVLARLGADHDLADADEGVLAERLDELAAAGLVRAA